MRIVHLNTYDCIGGAARAALRIHEQLRRSGVDSHMMVQHLSADCRWVVDSGHGIRDRFVTWMSQKMNRLPLRCYPARERVQWSTNWFGNGLARRVMRLNPDIVHVHWVGDGFLAIGDLARLQRPVVWTLHDLWPMTGGCHLPASCRRYEVGCGCCPQLGSARERDITRWTLGLKKRAWENTDVTLAATSRWMATCTQSSTLFRGRRIEPIPLGLDLNAFKPLDKAWARRTLNLREDTLVILGGALGLSADPNKGFQYLVEAARILSDRGWSGKAEMVFFGMSEPEHAPVTGLGTKYLGRLRDDVALAVAYSAADVFVCPSKEESFGQTVLEAMACGTPCVVFGVGGLVELVDHGITGYQARPQDSADLADGITWVLEDKDRWRRMAQDARNTIEQRFSSARVAGLYMELYSSLLHGDRAHSRSQA